MNKKDSWHRTGEGVGNHRAIYFVSPKLCIKFFRLSSTIFFFQKVQPIKYQHSNFDLKSNLPPPVMLLVGREEGMETIEAGGHKLETAPALLGLEYSRGRRSGEWGAEKFSCN